MPKNFIVGYYQANKMHKWIKVSKITDRTELYIFHTKMQKVKCKVFVYICVYVNICNNISYGVVKKDIKYFDNITCELQNIMETQSVHAP